MLVNNAAILPPRRPIVDYCEEQIAQALVMSIKVPLRLTAGLAPGMAKLGKGAVINIGVVNETAGLSLLSACKAAVHSLTRSWVAELGPQGIRVNTVASGPTLTAQNEQYADVIQQLVANHPARRAATAADVGAAVVFLASDDAAHIHGVTLPVDGGALTRSYVGI